MDSRAKPDSQLSITLRRARSSDAEAIMQIHHDAAFALAADHYDKSTLAAWAPLSSERLQRIKLQIDADKIASLTLVAECEGKAYGFGRLDLLTGEIASLYVLPEASGMGIGTKMLTALLFEAKKSSPREVWLNAALNAVPFYLAQGFSEVESIDYLLPGGQVMPVRRMNLRLD